MQHAGAVLIETAADTVAAELQRIGVAPLRRLTVAGEATDGGQTTRAGTGTQHRYCSSNQQHFDDIQAHGTIPLGMNSDDLV